MLCFSVQICTYFRFFLFGGRGGAEIDDYYSDVKYDRIAILNALGAYYSNLGKVETKQREREEYFIRATHYYNKASRIDQDEPTTFVGKGHLFSYKLNVIGVINGSNDVIVSACLLPAGQLLLAKGDLDQSSDVFKIVLDGRPDNVPALLGQVSMHRLFLGSYYFFFFG